VRVADEGIVLGDHGGGGVGSGGTDIGARQGEGLHIPSGRIFSAAGAERQQGHRQCKGEAFRHEIPPSLASVNRRIPLCLLKSISEEGVREAYRSTGSLEDLREGAATVAASVH
jgi:hypothetical protein